ncbi:MAG TPA: porin family protein [Pedobacter sp.]|jgi:hypothetical protein
MKKILFTATLLISSTLLFSQTKFGLKAGVNFANQQVSTQGISASFSSLTSFHFMGLVDYSISPAFSIQPGLGISGKGFKFDVEDVTGKINLMYLDIPINAVAKFPIKSLGKFFIGAGPYAAIGISGKGTADGEEDSDDLFSEEGGYKRGDFGMNFLGGLEFKNGITFNANYGLGLSNVAVNNEEDLSIKNKVFSISLGFLF